MTDSTIGSIDTRNAGSRSSVYLVASAIISGETFDVTVRDVSEKGARLLFKKGRVPTIGESGMLIRKETEVEFTVVWVANRDCGVTFGAMVAKDRLMESIAGPRITVDRPRFRRPGLRERAC